MQSVFGDFSLFEDMGISIPEDVFKECDTFQGQKACNKGYSGEA